MVRGPKLALAASLLSVLTVAPAALAQATDAASTPPDASWHPAKEADPPLLPAPKNGSLPPLSTSGTDVSGEAPRTYPGQAPAGDPHALEARVAALEARLAEERKRRHPDEGSYLWRHLKIGGFVQPQLLVQSTNAAGSPNRIGGALPPGISANDVIAKADGTTTNGTMFRMRRTRLRTTFETDDVRFYLQIEALPLSGEAPSVSTILRNAEATAKIHWTGDVSTEVTAGLFMVPFRYELVETSNVRPYVERTTFSQNAFPLERDIGVHARTRALADKLTVDVAVINGQRLGEPTFVALPDLNPSKDLVAWASYQLGPVLLGANGYLGRGQLVDGQNLRFKQFDRSAVNVFAHGSMTFSPRLGATNLVAELTFAKNLDAGLRYPTAMPRVQADFGADVLNATQRAFYVRVEQELGRILLAGYRYDVYAPDAGLKENGRDTHTFLVGARFSRHLRWTNELSYAIDNVHAPGTLPPSKTLVAFSSVLQAQF